MLVKSMTEEEIHEIGQAFGCYDYGQETGMTAAFSSKEKAAEYICTYVRGMLRNSTLRRLVRFGLEMKRGGLCRKGAASRQRYMDVKQKAGDPAGGDPSRAFKRNTDY